MKTYPLKNEEGKLHAFEIDNAGIGRNGVVRIVKGILGVELIKKPKFLSWLREEEFCQFMLGSHLFIVEEPFGDNSRYLVCTKPAGWCPQIQVVVEAFSKA